MFNVTTDSLVISSRDYKNLLAIIEKSNMPATEALEEELARAEVVNISDLPIDVVSMNSSVTFIDLDSSEKTNVTLVYPQEADVDSMKISILTPIGTALIGLRIGGRIDWPLPSGKTCRLRVVAVKQPD